MDDDVALDRAIGDAESGGGLRHHLLDLGLCCGRQLARQIAAILDEEGRVAIEIFVIAIGEARREAAPVHDHRFGGDLRAGKILLDHDTFAGRMLAREEERLGQILDLRHALHAAAAAAVDRLDDEIAAALDGDALQFLRGRDFLKPRHGHAGRGEAFFHRQLVASGLRGIDGDAGKAEAVGNRCGGDRRVGGDADHAVDLADLAAVTLRGSGRLFRAVDIGDDAGIGIGEARRLRVAVGNDDVKPHLLGAARGIGGFNSARNDEQRLVHQK